MRGLLTLEESAVRVWCECLAHQCESGGGVQHIARNGAPYLDRFYVGGWSPKNKTPGPAIFLHHFLASDSGTEVHSHPWAAVSLILAGGYYEHRCTPDGLEAHEYRPGDVNILEPTTRHRIDLIGADCWTLFVCGEYRQPWMFGPLC